MKPNELIFYHKPVISKSPMQLLVVCGNWPRFHRTSHSGRKNSCYVFGRP